MIAAEQKSIREYPQINNVLTSSGLNGTQKLVNFSQNMWGEDKASGNNLSQAFNSALRLCFMKLAIKSWEEELRL